MNPNALVRVVSVLVLASVALNAQVARPLDVPLKNWATPLYWQPNQAERAAIAPQLVFSANAVSMNALSFIAITPCRLVDTRGFVAGFNGVDPFAGPSIAAKGTLTIPVQSSTQTSTTEPAPCGAIPIYAEAYSFNLTVVPHAGGAVDYVSLWPAGGTQPFVATLNDPQGAIVANAAIVPAGAPYGGISVYNDGPSTTDVVIDMNGYFTPPTDGNANTAVGLGTLENNTTGGENTAIGAGALVANTTGYGNTASGEEALVSNTTGYYNTATGYSAMENNTTGYANTAVGISALSINTTGNSNTAIGFGALTYNTTGDNNIAIGVDAGSFTTSNDIDIGSTGIDGDSGVIRIGTAGTQTSAYVAGIYGKTVGIGNYVVCVDSTGKLGTSGGTGCSNTSSSRRFKEQITDMGDSSSKLFQLRPVTFFYKPQYDDGSHALQYGLIAEEVADLYPEMVGYDKDGQPASVKYQALAPMLLNELQKQNAELRKETEDRRAGELRVQKQNAELESQVQLQQEENRKLEDRLAALEALLSAQTSPTTRPTSSQ